MENIDVFIINCQNNERKERMKNRMDMLQISHEFVEAVNINDPRINRSANNPTACMMSHLKCIQNFLTSNKKYAIICEDDIYIRKDFKNIISHVIEDFQKLNLDILLLGYLINFDPGKSDNFNLIYKGDYFLNYYHYPDDLWGTQMYLINKKYAKFICSKFTLQWGLENGKTPFSSDWTITKNGNRALLFPMLAVEEGNKPEGTPRVYIDYHRSCKDFNYHNNFYV